MLEERKREREFRGKGGESGILEKRVFYRCGVGRSGGGGESE